MTSSSPHVVIIGGGFGGLDAARTLARAPVRVTLVDRHNYHVFQPLLYQVATASLSPADVAAPIRWILRHTRNIKVLLANVDAIDPVNRHVLLTAGPAKAPVSDGGPVEPTWAEILSFDYLIVATGAAHAYFGHSEWARRAPGLKTLDDALEIRRQLLLAFEAAERDTDPAARQRLLTFVIVGGGPTGVELAGALAEIARRTLTQDFRSIRTESARIILIEGAPDVLPTFPEKLRHAASDSLRRLGVEVRTGSIVTDVTEEGVRIGAETIAAQTVLWAAGVAASPVARSLGVPLDRAGRVHADPALTVPGHSNIFVVGDICFLEQDGRPLPGVAQVAKQQGAHAARNIVRLLRGEAAEPFRYFDYGNMATIGRGAAVAQIARCNLSGFFAWIVWLCVHIFWLIGFRNRLAVIGQWAWAFATFQRSARLITGERLWPGEQTRLK